MARIGSFSEGQLEVLAKVLGECGTGSEISRFFRECGLVDSSGESTKWRRLYSVFRTSQEAYGCANKIVEFIEKYLAPARFVGRRQDFEECRTRLNEVLAFSGLEYGPDGKFRRGEAVATLDQAEQRAQTIRAKLRGRNIHPEVMKYCRAELMRDNYFHAVFEATKGLAQRIRDMTGIQGDGAALIDAVFAINRPILAFNTLRTESEKSEHKGIAMLLKGTFLAVRNPRAHEPKILWNAEDDVVDLLTFLSLLQRRLDSAVRVPRQGEQ